MKLFIRKLHITTNLMIFVLIDNVLILNLIQVNNALPRVQFFKCGHNAALFW